MEPLKVMATIDGSLYEVEVNQTDPHHARFSVSQQGKQIGILHKENNKWLADDQTCLMPADVSAIGKAIDNNIKEF